MNLDAGVIYNLKNREDRIMEFPNYARVFDELYNSTKASDIDHIALHGGSVGSHTEYKELRTLRLGGIRQSGKTTWLIEKLKSESTFIALFRDELSLTDAVRKSAPPLQSFGDLTDLMTHLRTSPNTVTCIIIDDASTVAQHRWYGNLTYFLAEMKLEVKPIIVCLG